MRNLVLATVLVLAGSLNALIAQDSAEPGFNEIAMFEESISIENDVFEDEEKPKPKTISEQIDRNEFKRVLYQVVSAKYKYQYNRKQILANGITEDDTKKATKTADEVSYKTKKKKAPMGLELVNDLKKFVEDLQRIETKKYDFILEPDTGKFQNTRLYKLGVKIVLK